MRQEHSDFLKGKRSSSLQRVRTSPLLPETVVLNVVGTLESPGQQGQKHKNKKTPMPGHQSRPNCHPRPSKRLEVVPGHVLNALRVIQRHRVENPRPIPIDVLKASVNDSCNKETQLYS